MAPKEQTKTDICNSHTILLYLTLSGDNKRYFLVTSKFMLVDSRKRLSNETIITRVTVKQYLQYLHTQILCKYILLTLTAKTIVLIKSDHPM